MASTADKAVIDTLIAEAGSNPAGLRAVAAVINNRSNQWGLTPTQVVQQPNQFEGYSNPGPGSIQAQQMQSVRDAAEQAWNDVVSGNYADPTNGGTSFRTTGQTGGMSMPYGSVNIGGNTFALGNQQPSQAMLAYAAPAPLQPEASYPSPSHVTASGAANSGSGSGNLVTLASGNKIATGIYNQGDHSVYVSDDGNGNAVVQRISGPGSIPGIIDPMQEANAPTLAGDYIRSVLPQGLAGLGSSLSSTAGNVKDTALNAAGNLGGQIQGLGSNLLSGFNSLFGNGSSGLGALGASGTIGIGSGASGLAALEAAPTPFPYPSFYGLQALPAAQPVVKAVQQPVVPSVAPGTSFLQNRGVSTANQTAGQIANALNDQLSGSHHGSFSI